MGQGMKSLRIEGEKKEKENKHGLLNSRSLNVFFPLFVLPLGEVRLWKMSYIPTTNWKKLYLFCNDTLLV